MNDLYEVHTHLYGCLKEEDIHWLGKRKSPRWHIFRDSYRKIYQREPNLEILNHYRIWETSELNDKQKEILRTFYVYDESKPKGFLYFQNCFDFVISLSHTDPEELRVISLRVIGNQKEIYSEYRMMFSPLVSQIEFEEKVHALIEGFQKAEKEFFPKKSKLVISLNREFPLYEWQYEILKSLKNKYPNQVLVGIDFAGYEENDPPKEKQAFLEKVITEKQFVVLYHVGESFTNKSPSSAIRWIHEVSKNAHRLGHCVALAYTEERVKDQVYIESVQERNDHLEYLMKFSETNQWHYQDYLYQKQKELSSMNENDSIQIKYEDKELRLHREFWEFVIKDLKTRNVVIESCPTSNLRILGFSPLKFFINHGLTVCIGADDPGIFSTSLEEEFRLAEKILHNKEQVENLKKNNQTYNSWNIQKQWEASNQKHEDSKTL